MPMRRQVIGSNAAAVEHDNVWATQFHPEKSGDAGLHMLGNFVARCAAASKLR